MKVFYMKLEGTFMELKDIKRYFGKDEKAENKALFSAAQIS